MDRSTTNLARSETETSPTGSLSCDRNASEADELKKSGDKPKAQYVHSSLLRGEIRVFKLLPRQIDGLICIRLEHKSFQDLTEIPAVDGSRVSYYALSYVWGPKTQMREIEVNGQAFQVRLNLWKFLRRLESPTFPSHFMWADAISINQNDIEEKAEQVTMMGDIYHLAHGVLAWTGEEFGDSAFILNLAEAIWDWTHTDTAVGQLYAASTRLRAWRALQRFLDRPYWKRTWIVQEITLARGQVWIYCGVDNVPYPALYGLYQIFIRRYDLGDLQSLLCRGTRHKGPCVHQELIDCAAQVWKQIIPSPRSYHRTLERSRLLDLLYRYTDTNCEDRRDKVFALLHMQADIPRDRARKMIDYSVDIHELFFMILSVYTNRGPQFPLGEVQRIMREGNNDDKELLYNKLTSGDFDLRNDPQSEMTRCSILLMKSLGISLQSLGQWLYVTRDSRRNMRLPLRMYPSVEFELAGGRFGARSIVTGVLPLCSDRLRNTYYLFDIVDGYLAERPHIRGVSSSVRLGDCVYRAVHSDVAFVSRNIESQARPISWAIVGEGGDWFPQLLELMRLFELCDEMIPQLSDIDVTDTRYELNEIMELIKPKPDKDSDDDDTDDGMQIGSYEHKVPKGTPGQASLRIMVHLDHLVAVIVIEGHLSLRLMQQASRSRGEGLSRSGEQDEPTPRNQKKTKEPKPRQRLEHGRRWKYRRPPWRIRVRVCFKTKRQACRAIWQMAIVPAVNMNHRRQRLSEAQQWLKYMSAAAPRNDRHDSEVLACP